MTAKAADVKDVTHQMPTKALQVDVYPYSAVGIIKIYINGKYLGHGTGSLIAPKLVLTVAHNCDPMNLSSITDLYFVPAPIFQRNGNGFKVIKIHQAKEYKEVLNHKEYNKNPGFLYDYAVLELDTE